MIKNCEGCQEDWGIICSYVSQGYHVATTKEIGFLNKKHIELLLVDDEGELVAYRL